MKKPICTNSENGSKLFNVHFFFILLTVIITLILTSCASFLYSVNIRSANNLSSVLAGGSLQLRASGRDIVWSVSTRSDGSGSPASGTYISATGLLTAAVNETASVLYIIARSLRDGYSDIKQVRIVTVSGVTVSSTSQIAVAGRTLQFRAQVTGTNSPDQNVTWRVNSNSSSINSSGVLIVSANETASTLLITAASIIDPSKSGSASVSVVIPVVTNVTVTAASSFVRAGESIQLRAVISGTYEPSQSVTWRVSSNAAGTGAVTPGTNINNSGLLTIANNESLTILYVIATSAYDRTKFGSIAVPVIIPTVSSVTVTPANQSVQAGSSFQFYAAVAGSNNPNISVTWKVSTNAAGTGAVTPGTNINMSGRLTIAANETASMLFVFATSVFDPSKTGSVIINVTAPPVVTPSVTSVTVTPVSQTVQAGGTIQFTASVTGTNNPPNNVTWKVSSNAAGTGAVTAGTSISANGLLTVAANETLSALYIFAASVFDPSKTGSVTVNVTVPVVVTPPVITPPPAVSTVTITPSSASAMANNSSNTVQFHANIPVTWRVSSNTAGTGSVESRTVINENGLLTVAPNEGARFLYVFAYSTANNSLYSMATVTITNNQ